MGDGAHDETNGPMSAPMGRKRKNALNSPEPLSAFRVNHIGSPLLCPFGYWLSAIGAIREAMRAKDSKSPVEALLMSFQLIPQLPIRSNLR
jgi:hypothetical protein